MIRKLCDAMDLPEEGTLKAFVDGRADSELSLCVGVLDGQAFAVNNRCPHQGAPLSAGHLEGDLVVCPIHSWKFCLRDGQPDHASDPPVRAYEVRRYGDEIFVRLPNRPAA